LSSARVFGHVAGSFETEKSRFEPSQVRRGVTYRVGSMYNGMSQAIVNGAARIKTGNVPWIKSDKRSNTQ
jgi:hypothetical protein